MWAAADLPNGIHVCPVEDAIDHDLDTHDCPCGPAFELQDSGCWLVTHHSLDGREQFE